MEPPGEGIFAPSELLPGEEEEAPWAADQEARV